MIGGYHGVVGFLAAVWGNGPHSLCWQTESGFRVRGFITDPHELYAQLGDLQSTDVWIGAHPLRAVPASGRAKGADVVEVVAIPADLDWAHETRRTDKPLPTEGEVRERLGLLGPDLQPSIVVHSGHGLQPWWLLRRPVTPDEGAGLVGQLNAALADVDLENGRPDLASIMRLPGTRNHKGDGEPVPVVIETIDCKRLFLPEYLRKLLPAAVARPSGSGSTKHRPGAVTDDQQGLLDYVKAHHGAHSEDIWGDGSIHVVRPGKLAKDGSSASIITGEDGDALLTVFSDNWPDIGPGPGEASRSWMLGPDGELHHPHAMEARVRINASAPVVARPDPPRNLPDEFWKRPELAALRTWAHARMRSADAVYAAVRARVGTLVPHTLRVDTGIAVPISLNSLLAIIGTSGAGKTTSAALARDLVPIDTSGHFYEGPLGSGEGVVELYYEAQEQPNPGGGKAIKVRVQAKKGALLLLDEGEALTQMAGRLGATLLPTLRSAYSGEMIGQSNARQETRRVLAAGSYRFVLLVGLQDVAAIKLLADEATGTPQRFVFFNANDPAIPPEVVDASPPWSAGPWVPPTITGGQTMTLDPDVLAEIRGRQLAIQRGTLVLDPLDAHRDQNRIKEAGMLAILDGRLQIIAEDWRLAGMVLDTSDAVRAGIIDRAGAANGKVEDERTRAAVRRQLATVQALDADAHERAVAGGARAMARLAARSKPDSLTRTKLSVAVAGNHRKMAAVDEMIERGEALDWVRRTDDGRWVAGSSAPT